MSELNSEKNEEKFGDKSNSKKIKLEMNLFTCLLSELYVESLSV